MAAMDMVLWCYGHGDLARKTEVCVVKSILKFFNSWRHKCTAETAEGGV